MYVLRVNKYYFTNRNYFYLQTPNIMLE